jgi:hypothetical protein
METTAMFESMAGPLARAQIDDRHRVAAATRKGHARRPAAANHAHAHKRLRAPKDRRRLRLLGVRAAISAVFAQASRTEV